jgi:hypothetical protein
MDSDKKRLFLERMRASPFPAGATHKSKPKEPPASQLPPASAKGTSTGVEILTDDEIGLTCSNGLGPPAFFDLGGATPLAHQLRSRHFVSQVLI